MEPTYIIVNATNSEVATPPSVKLSLSRLSEAVKNTCSSLWERFQQPSSVDEKIKLLEQKMITKQEEYIKLHQYLEETVKSDALKSLTQYTEKNKLALDKMIELTKEIANDKKEICLHVNLTPLNPRPQFIPLDFVRPVEALQQQINSFTGESFVVDNFPPPDPGQKKLQTDQAKVLLIKLQSMCDQLLRFECQEYLNEINNEYDQVDKAMRKVPANTLGYLEFADTGYHLRTRLKLELDMNLVFLKERVSTSVKTKLKEYESLASHANKARSIHLKKKSEVQKIYNQMREISDELRKMMEIKQQMMSTAPNLAML